MIGTAERTERRVCSMLALQAQNWSAAFCKQQWCTESSTLMREASLVFKTSQLQHLFQVCRKIDKGPKSINQVRICLQTFMSNLSFYQCLNTSEVFSLTLNDSTHIWWEPYAEQSQSILQRLSFWLLAKRLQCLLLDKAWYLMTCDSLSKRIHSVLSPYACT